MSKVQEFTVFADKVGNLFDRTRVNADGGFQIYPSANTATTVVAAGAASCTLAAISGSKYVVDAAQVCIASIAANTTVTATLYDGTTARWQKTFSANGQYDLLTSPTGLDKISIVGSNNTALAVHVSTAGASSTTTVNLAAHEVANADF